MTKNIPQLSFSIIDYAAWIVDDEPQSKWYTYTNDRLIISNSNTDPPLKAMPSMLRRRANMPGKMALEVAYRCLGEQTNLPIIFCSRHGEGTRSVELLLDVIRGNSPSPTAFSLSVHNACGGLFSIARCDVSNQIALAASQNTIEHGVIEACGLLADGAAKVLLVAYDNPIPEIFKSFQDCKEQPYAFAWLMQQPEKDIISLAWSKDFSLPLEMTQKQVEMARNQAEVTQHQAKMIQQQTETAQSQAEMAQASCHPEAQRGIFKPPMAGLEILHFFLSQEPQLKRIGNGQQWQWTRHHV